MSLAHLPSAIQTSPPGDLRRKGWREAWTDSAFRSKYYLVGVPGGAAVLGTVEIESGSISLYHVARRRKSNLPEPPAGALCSSGPRNRRSDGRARTR